MIGKPLHFLPVWCKCRDQDEAIWSQAPKQGLPISCPLVRLDKKMEHRAIVPNVINAGRNPIRHVGNYPIDPICHTAEPGPCLIQRRGSNVEHGDVFPAAVDKGIHQSGGTASNIDHR